MLDGFRWLIKHHKCLFQIILTTGESDCTPDVHLFDSISIMTVLLSCGRVVRKRCVSRIFSQYNGDSTIRLSKKHLWKKTFTAVLIVVLGWTAFYVTFPLRTIYNMRIMDLFLRGDTDTPPQRSILRGRVDLPHAYVPSTLHRDFPFELERCHFASARTAAYWERDTSTLAERVWPRLGWWSWKSRPGGWVTCGSAR